MKNQLGLLLIVLLSIFATSAFAGNVYVSGSGGLTILQDLDIEASQGNVTISGDLTHETGWNAGGAIGYDFGYFRSEFEITYRENAQDTITFNTVQSESTDNTSALSYLVNGYFDLENSSSITPYFGGGIGFATIDYGGDLEDTVFAYKLSAGAAYEFTKQFALTLDYSFFGTSDTSDEEAGITFDSEYHSHNFNAGLKYNF